MSEKVVAGKDIRKSVNALAVSSALLAASFTAYPLESRADPANGNAGITTENTPAPETQDFSRAPLIIQNALRIVFDETTPAESRSLTDTEDGKEEQTAVFHARDSRGRMELYQVTASTDLATNHTALFVRVCTDRNREEVGSETIECASTGQDGLEFLDTNLDGIVDGVITQHAAPDLLGETFVLTARGDRNWNQRSAQRAFEETLRTVEGHLSILGTQDLNPA